VIEWLT